MTGLEQLHGSGYGLLSQALVLKIVGTFVTVSGLAIQWIERNRNNSHNLLKDAISGHLKWLEETSKADEDRKPDGVGHLELPGSGMTLDEIDDLMSESSKVATESTKEQLGDLVQRFDAKSRNLEPIFNLSWLLVIAGAVILAFT